MERINICKFLYFSFAADFDSLRLIISSLLFLDGPTEGNVITQYLFPLGAQSNPIGRPDDNVHTFIVDSTMHLAPIGVPGELLFSGPRLAMGYFGQPELTAEKFIPNPCFYEMSHDLPPALQACYRIAYRTGELCRWRSDGNIEYMGRIDRQTKISGVRLELGEVEAALAQVAGVKSVVAAAVAHGNGVKHLVGYVTPAIVNPDDVLAHCRQNLLPAMVPSIVLALDALPLLPNGKVDIKSLPAPDWSGVLGESVEYIAPTDDIESAVQSAFAEVLGRPAEDISMLSGFFALGGTSLQAMRLPALLAASVGVTLLASEIMAVSIARDIANLLKESKMQDFSGAVEPIEWPDNRRQISSGQESLCLTCFANPDSLEVTN